MLEVISWWIALMCSAAALMFFVIGLCSSYGERRGWYIGAGVFAIIAIIAMII